MPTESKPAVHTATPTPWFSEDGNIVARYALDGSTHERWVATVRAADGEKLRSMDWANCDHIVRAVNAHQPLVEALRDLLVAMSERRMADECRLEIAAAERALALSEVQP